MLGIMNKNMEEQTALEWFVDQLINVDRPNHINRRMLPLSKNSLKEKEFQELVEKAKLREKEMLYLTPLKFL